MDSMLFCRKLAFLKWTCFPGTVLGLASPLLIWTNKMFS